MLDTMTGFLVLMHHWTHSRLRASSCVKCLCSFSLATIQLWQKLLASPIRGIATVTGASSQAPKIKLYTGTPQAILEGGSTQTACIVLLWGPSEILNTEALPPFERTEKLSALDF